MDNLTAALNNYIQDTENPERNYDIAVQYFLIGQTAAAISFYIRAAERTSDKELAYECLLRVAQCFDMQGDRHNSVRGAYKHAMCLLPERPEAYFLASKFNEKNRWYIESYLQAEQGLNFAKFDLKPLRSDVGYIGKYGLVFQKAISSYWWGKTEESRNLFISLLSNNYGQMSEEYIKTATENLSKLGMPPELKYDNTKNNLDIVSNIEWSTLTYDDIVTIQREIGLEDVYGYWRGVKENDVVVDIGASVGPFVCTILKNKPSKIYCVEPSKVLVKTLKENIKNYNSASIPVIYTEKAIVGDYNKVNIFGGSNEFETTTFMQFIKENGIEKINYLKIDCEGGEYSIFSDENIEYLLNNVEYIAMETHLNYPGCRDNFKKFRDKYLTKFSNYRVLSCTTQNISKGNTVDLRQSIFDDDFIMNYTCEFMIYIFNEPQKKKEFDWGSNQPEYANLFREEIFDKKVYERYFTVKEGDTVVDFGANAGAFAYSIIDKNPKEIYCIEPSKTLQEALRNNTQGHPVTIINKAISDVNVNDREVPDNGVYIHDNRTGKYDCITFKQIIDQYNIEKIDFLKFDCEGGEYFIFTEENVDFIKNNVKYMAGEWHISHHENSVEKFKKFRDLYLKNHENFHVFDRYDNDITQNIFDDDYLQKFDEYHKNTFQGQFLIYINNENQESRKNNVYAINKSSRPRAWIIDDFYEDPESMRNFALQQNFVEGGYGRGFIGRRTDQQFLFPGLKERFEEIMGRKIVSWESHGMNGRFQVAWAGEPLVYHCDSQKWAGMLYLTPDAPWQCGTTLWASRKTRARDYYHPRWAEDFKGETTLDRTPYEPVDVIGNVFNRLVIFDASSIHSASEYFGFNMNNARLWQMFFFD
jgi:FkbM family methyltransferase